MTHVLQVFFFFFFQAEDGIRDATVTGVQTCALPISKAGVSIGVDDMVIPARKQEIVENARKAVLEVERQRLDGAITHGERHNKIIDIWHRATEHGSDQMFSDMKRVEAASGEFNPIFMMAGSGARGSKEQGPPAA